MKLEWTTIAVAGLLVGTLHAQQTALTAQDYLEIQQLYARFSHALDSAAGGGSEYAQLFTADGSYTDEAGRTVSGREQLVAYAKQGSDRTPTNVRHFVYNVWAEPAPGGATGKAYVVMATVSAAGQPAKVLNGGQFHDELVKTADGWRFKTRRFVRAQPGGGGRGAQPPQPAAQGR
jgi:hypothetical protein